MAEETKPTGGQETDELKDYRNEDGTFNEDKLKQAMTEKKYYRQQISKLRNMPAKVEEYGENFTLDSKFDEFVSDEKNKEKIDKVFNKLDSLCFDKGINVERNHDIRRFLLDEMTESGVIDLTPKADKEAQEKAKHDAYLKELQDGLGDTTNVDAWSEALLDWLKTFANSEGEYSFYENIVKTNANGALSMNKIRQAMMGNRIPIINSDPQYNEEEWQRNFNKADVETQNKMLEERAKKLTKKL